MSILFTPAFCEAGLAHFVKNEQKQETSSCSLPQALSFFLAREKILSLHFLFRENLRKILENFEINLWKNLETLKNF